jgi:hypothetical protein
VIRFVLHPGFVVSPNDGDEHRIGAPQLADLYGVPLSECIVFDPAQPGPCYGRGDLSQYLHLFPSDQGAAYWHVSDVERAQYPIKEPAEHGFFVRAGERRFAVLRVRSIASVYHAVRARLSS